MENALLIALSRQVVMERQLEVVANNIANASTPGFKAEQMMFVEFLAQTETGDTVSYVQDLAVVRDFGEGELTRTGNTFDLAIHGKGWFVIDTPTGPAYTRNGHFSLDPQGQLTTSGGNPVLDSTGVPITFGAADNDIVISADGSITTSAGEKGRLNIVTFADEKALDKASDSLYVTDQPPVAATEAKVMQGMIEAANVEPIVEIANMITALRSYQSAQQVVVGDDGLVRNAIEVLTDQAA